MTTLTIFSFVLVMLIGHIMRQPAIKLQLSFFFFVYLYRQGKLRADIHTAVDGNEKKQWHLMREREKNRERKKKERDKIHDINRNSLPR